MKQRYKTQINILDLDKQHYGLFKELCHYSKNLYNFTLYQVRQHYFQTNNFLNYNSCYHYVKNNENYKLLPSQTAQQTMKFVDRNMKSFFSLIRKKQRNEYKEKVKLCSYLPKDGTFLLVFTEAHFKVLDDYKVKLTCKKELLKKYNLDKLTIPFPKHLKNERIKEIRILPCKSGKYFRASFIYYSDKEKIKLNENNILSMDLGVNNLITMVDNVNKRPIIFDGKEIKSINRFWNKRNSKLKSLAKIINKSNNTNQLYQLKEKRKHLLNDKFHKISKFLIEYCKENEISKIVIGYNKQWKQNINIGKKNNQNFVQIPFGRLIKYIEYKAEHFGIEIILQEESYTSKVSCLSREEIKKKEQYNGKRIKRGLFKDFKLNQIINSDVNGALNILRKSKNEFAFKQIINRGLVNNPLKIRIKSNWSYQTFQEAISFR